MDVALPWFMAGGHAIVAGLKLNKKTTCENNFSTPDLV
jgi:hypothetical protein